MEDNKKKRAELPPEITEDVHSFEELFQNEVIRPVIKTQSELIKLHVMNQLKVMKVNFSDLDQLKREKQLRSLMQNHQQFKREIIGIVLGQLRTEEMNTYFTMQKEINRRIVQIVGNRMVDQLT